ncbi:MAG: flavodoxin family protein [Erysipelotrichaceae bacterium]|nr:flavodoxin family protein [Erysipelotrichaceae bacterium]
MKGVEVEYIYLYRLEKYTGCVSCFSCKRKATFGKCILKDGLYDVLEKIRNADGLVIGSPNYLGDVTASFRALYERLIFQSLTYNLEKPCCNEHMIPVLFILTSNSDDSSYEANGYYSDIIPKYKNTFETYVGPTIVLICGNTLQVNDYSLYDWTMMDGKGKKEHHDKTFNSCLKKAYKMGQSLV